jgi:hypothetical protein
MSGNMSEGVRKNKEEAVGVRSKIINIEKRLGSNSCTKEMPAKEYRRMVAEEEPIRYSYKASWNCRRHYKFNDRAQPVRHAMEIDDGKQGDSEGNKALHLAT